MARERIAINEADLRDMISEAVRRSINEMLDGPEGGSEERYAEGDMISTQEVADFIEKGGMVTSRPSSRDCDLVTTIGSLDRLRMLLSGSGGRDRTLYVCSLRKSCTEDDLLGWQIRRNNGSSMDLEPRFKDPEVQKAWDDDIESAFRDKSEWVGRWGAH